MTSASRSERCTRLAEGSCYERPNLGAAATWLDSAQPLNLPTREIHVWRVFADNMVDRLPRLEQVLSAGERAQVARYRDEADRSCRIIARGVLRSLLSMYLETSAGAVRISFGRHDKPMLDPKSSKKPIEFNVSHSSGVVLLAFSLGAAIGVDVEAVRTDGDLRRLTARVLASEEIAVLEEAGRGAGAQLFYRAWARKEAVLKALGTGFLVEPDQVIVLEDSSSASARCACYPPTGAARTLQVLDLPVGKGFAAALAFDGVGAKVRLFSDSCI